MYAWYSFGNGCGFIWLFSQCPIQFVCGQRADPNQRFHKAVPHGSPCGLQRACAVDHAALP